MTSGNCGVRSLLTHSYRGRSKEEFARHLMTWRPRAKSVFAYGGDSARLAAWSNVRLVWDKICEFGPFWVNYVSSGA